MFHGEPGCHRVGARAKLAAEDPPTQPRVTGGSLRFVSWSR